MLNVTLMDFLFNRLFICTRFYYLPFLFTACNHFKVPSSTFPACLDTHSKDIFLFNLLWIDLIFFFLFFTWFPNSSSILVWWWSSYFNPFLFMSSYSSSISLNTEILILKSFLLAHLFYADLFSFLLHLHLLCLLECT